MSRQYLEPSGQPHEQHGAFVRPGYRVHATAIGCGDYRDYLDYEAEQANGERLREQQARFEPILEPVTYERVSVVTEPEPDLYVDRRAILHRLDDDPEFKQRPDETWLECCERQQEAVNLTACAETFRRWIELGCPITKGK